MVLIAEAQQVKAKLQLKGRWRPDKMVRKKMPDGTGLLANVPQRRTSSRAVDDSVQDATLDQEYCDAIDKVSAVFGRQKRSNSTADEHRMYIRMLDGWLVRKGFGSYVEAIFDKHGLLVEVRPRRTATGEVKVLKFLHVSEEKLFKYLGYHERKTSRGSDGPDRRGLPCSAPRYGWGLRVIVCAWSVSVWVGPR